MLKYARWWSVDDNDDNYYLVSPSNTHHPPLAPSHTCWWKLDVSKRGDSPMAVLLEACKEHLPILEALLCC
jgi:hypothetical protein